MLAKGHAKDNPSIFQDLQYLNKRLFQAIKLHKLIKNNDYVIFDRWSLSAYVYGRASGIDNQTCLAHFNGLREPTATIILDGDKLQRGEDDVYEADSAMQTRVKTIYKEWAKNHTFTCRLIDGNGMRGEVHERIVNELREMEVIQ